MSTMSLQSSLPTICSFIFITLSMSHSQFSGSHLTCLLRKLKYENRKFKELVYCVTLSITMVDQGIYWRLLEFILLQKTKQTPHIKFKDTFQITFFPTCRLVLLNMKEKVRSVDEDSGFKLEKENVQSAEEVYRG